MDNVHLTNDSDLLQYALTHGMIDAETIRKSILEETKKKYLQMHKYAVFQGKDGRWRTTLPDKLAKNGRRLIAKTNLEDLNELLITHYKEEEALQSRPRIDSSITLEELYPIWLQSRILEATNIRTVKRNDQEWRRYYLGTEITKIPMSQLTANQLKDWAHQMIDTYHFNKRDYYDMTLIMKKCFEYLSGDHICHNTWADVKINTKKLQHMDRAQGDTQVYFEDEKIMIIKHAIQRFLERPWNIGTLAVPLLFVTGVRIGELVALKDTDFVGNEIQIAHMEVNDYRYDEEEKRFIYQGKKIENYCKTEAGKRTIPYNQTAKQIVALIQKSRTYYQYEDHGFLFCPQSRRLTSNSVDKLIYRYCEELGIPKKSAHKIRKTYISQMIRNNVDLDSVCRIAGHVDMKTTFESYYYALERKEVIYQQFDEIFQSKQYFPICAASK